MGCAADRPGHRQLPREFLEFLAPDEISEVEKSDPTWLDCRGNRYMMALKRGKKGCFFLGPDARCTVYDARPILCRLYPFKLKETSKGKFKGFSLHKKGDVECPRHKDGILPARPLYELYLEDCEHQDAYDRLVRVFNRKQRRNPQDFIGMFYEERRTGSRESG